MAGAALVKFDEYDVALGRRVSEVLVDDARLDAKALFWWYDSDLDEWKFVVATPIYDKTDDGPQKAYLHVRNLLLPNDLLSELPLSSIRVLSAEDPIITALRTLFGEVKSAAITLSGVRVNEVHLDDVLLHDLKKT